MKRVAEALLRRAKALCLLAPHALWAQSAPPASPHDPIAAFSAPLLCSYREELSADSLFTLIEGVEVHETQPSTKTRNDRQFVFVYGPTGILRTAYVRATETVADSVLTIIVAARPSLDGLEGARIDAVTLASDEPTGVDSTAPPINVLRSAERQLTKSEILQIQALGSGLWNGPCRKAKTFSAPRTASAVQRREAPGDGRYRVGSRQAR